MSSVKSKLQQIVARLSAEYKESKTAPLSERKMKEAKEQKYSLTCDIHLKGLVRRLISEYGIEKGIIILRKKYGVVRDTHASMICIDKASPFYLLRIETYTII